MAEQKQEGFDFSEDEKTNRKMQYAAAEKEYEAEKAKEKARQNKAAAEYTKDNRVPTSPLIRQAEIEKMKEIVNKPKATKSGGGGGTGTLPKTGSKQKELFKKGGKVSSASARADGIAIRGKTKA
tara:strand:- start:426 stop:800 length:375 start_codon:yes stop_codon:yes gene_type:complete